MMSCCSEVLAAQTNADYRVQAGALRLEIYISETAHMFHIVDQISQWSEFCHRQYVTYFEGLEGGINEQDKELLAQHRAIRRVHGWGQGLEQTFYTPLDLDSALALAVKEGRLTEEEARTEQRILTHFKERAEHLMLQESPTLKSFVQKLLAEEPNLTTFADDVSRFVGSTKLTIPVYLFANPDDRNCGGGFNGGRLTLEIARNYDMYPTLLHELFHAFIKTRQEAIDKAARSAPGLDAETLSEGLAYAYSPRIIHTDDSDKLLAAARGFMSRGSSLGDSYTRFNLYGLALRPLLKEALYDKQQSLEDFLPRAIDAWLVLNELDKARGVKSGAQTPDYRKDPRHSIFIFGPVGKEGWESLRSSVDDHLFGRGHAAKDYEEILTKHSKAGDKIILLFSLDGSSRLPQQFSDLMPLSWPDVESRLKQGKTVFEQGKKREMTVFLLAAPTVQNLHTEFRRLVEEKKFTRKSNENIGQAP